MLHSSTYESLAALFAIVFAVAACGSDDSNDQGRAGEVLDDLGPGSISDATDMETLAGTSAPNVFVSIYLPIFLAEQAIDGGETCPSVTEDADGTTYLGDCTNSEGTIWHGQAIIEDATGEEEGEIRYEGFGFSGDDDGCAGSLEALLWDGVVVVTGDPEGTPLPREIRFGIDVVASVSAADENCDPFESESATEYSITMIDKGEEKVWSGSGRIGNTETGVIAAETVDERIDSTLCDSEALSGTTTITAGDDVAVITYDGETDCDPESTVTWTLNGEDQGELTGVRCSAGGGAASPWLVVVFASALVFRRRRRLRRTSI